MLRAVPAAARGVRQGKRQVATSPTWTMHGQPLVAVVIDRQVHVGPGSHCAGIARHEYVSGVLPSGELGPAVCIQNCVWASQASVGPHAKRTVASPATVPGPSSLASVPTVAESLAPSLPLVSPSFASAGPPSLASLAASSPPPASLALASGAALSPLDVSF